MSIRLELNLLFSQVSLFDTRLVDPFNDWTEDHLQQGFSWRPGSVSLLTVGESGPIDVDIELVGTPVVRPSASRAILLPFVCWSGLIEVSTIASSELVDIPQGPYGLLFQSGFHFERPWASVGLIHQPRNAVEPAILRADDRLRRPRELLMDAQPAA